MLREAGFDAELSRLRLLEAIYDPYSQRALGFAGIEPGWNCLELGAGAGSIATWLSHAVGPGGAVVAIDLDPRFLVDLPANVEVRAVDVRHGDISDGYDLIHARCLLQHLTERAE